MTLVRIARLFVFEWRKLLARRLVIVAVLVILLVSALAPFADQVMTNMTALSQGKRLTGDEGENAWTSLTTSLKAGFLFVVVVTLVFSASTISEEWQHGTLKTILIRPVRRTEVLLAKWLTLVSFAVALVVLLTVGSAILGELRYHEFPNILQDPRYKNVYATREVMLTQVLTNLRLLLPGLAALVSLGLLFSCAFDHAGYAVGATGVIYLMLWLGKEFSRKGGAYVFATYVDAPLDELAKWTHALTRDPKKVHEEFVRMTLLVPSVSAVVFLLMSAVTFAFREIGD